MGSRVNYVTIIDGRVTRFGQSGGAGYGLDYYFAAGPSVVLRWLDALAGDEDDYLADWWYDDVSCEGGVLIDVDRRHLLLFTNLGAFGSIHRYAYRASMLEAYARTWAGWSIQWAFDGIADILAYLGEDRRTVRRELSIAADLYPYDRDSAATSPGCVVSVATPAGCRAYGVNISATECCRIGPGLLELLVDAELTTSPEHMPSSGLHIDAARRYAGVWSIEALEGLTEWWDGRWPGWTLEFWGDDYHRQLANCAALALPAIDPSESLVTVATRVERNWPVDATMRERGVDVDRLRDMNFGGMRSRLAANVTPAEVSAIVNTILGR